MPASPRVAADAIQVPSPPEHGNQLQVAGPGELVDGRRLCEAIAAVDQGAGVACEGGRVAGNGDDGRHVGGSDLRSEEHTSELQSLMRISYAVFCLKKKKKHKKLV